MPGEISLSFDGLGDSTINITAAPSMMHPESCSFHVSQPLYPDNSSHFTSPEDSHGSPLVDALLALGSVTGITITHDRMNISITGDATWDDYIPRIGEIIRDVLVSGTDPISAAVADNQLPTEEVQARVQRILDDTINPAVAAHGGIVNLLEVANNTVYLEFAGGCQGCGMINVTLKYGVERAIRDELPQVGEILDTTDHASGRNPYYAPSAK